MDQYGSRRRQDPRRSPQGGTPIYDRLLAEWQAARDRAAPPEAGAPGPAPSRASGLVPGARTSAESPRD
ncbi:hypothetical protein [Streptomyces sp. NPDC059783]|uniref:hypothetical protein n=1 Tax=Streptomyces sp. NPDC059783 TaxID=3346944 RepID=UPI0036679569